jgi:hypothetical protein
MKILSVDREDVGRVIEPRKRTLDGMVDGVRLLRKTILFRTLWEGLDNILGVVGTGHASKVYIGII